MFNYTRCSFLHDWLCLTDAIIGNIRKQYVDTRTQANLSKLNAHRHKDLDIATEELSLITERRQRVEMIEQMMQAHISTSPIWESKRLEVCGHSDQC